VTRLEQVPVGGGLVLAAEQVVLTRPDDATLLAFDTLCPHAGCRVKAVAAGMISCFCHGSRFRIADGSVAGGPSPSGLTPRTVTVDPDGEIHLPTP
jgi:Rieske Fe-S protein